jgi:hypothetical protein
MDLGARHHLATIAQTPSDENRVGRTDGAVEISGLDVEVFAKRGRLNTKRLIWWRWKLLTLAGASVGVPEIRKAPENRDKLL